jgi:hypothetical protein
MNISKSFFLMLLLSNIVFAGDNPCKLNANGEIIKGDSFASFYKDISCNTGGIISEVYKMYKVGLCKSNPVIGSAGGSSDLSSCFWISEAPTGQLIDVASSADISLNNPVLPPAGTYNYAVFIASNEISIKAAVTFESTTQGANGAPGGKVCYTNGLPVTESGTNGPYFNTTPLATVTQSGLAANCASDASLAAASNYNLQYIESGPLGNTTNPTSLPTKNGTINLYLVNDDLLQPTSLTGKNIGTTRMIGVFTNPITILDGDFQGAQSCFTSAISLDIDVSTGANVNMFTSSSIIEDIKLYAFYFGFKAETVCQQFQ